MQNLIEIGSVVSEKNEPKGRLKPTVFVLYNFSYNTKVLEFSNVRRKQ